MNHLVVFARWPRPGSVKTRFSPAIPPEEACALHHAMLLDVLESGAAAAADRRYLYWSDAPVDAAWPELPRRLGYLESIQRGNDLGARMESMFDELLPAAGHRVVVVGGDLPEVTSAHIDLAFTHLGRADGVIGPTPDGGYYLLGLARRAPGLFHDVAWGTPAVIRQTRERAAEVDLVLATLDPLEDIDIAADVVALALRTMARGDGRPCHTVACLQRLGLLPRFALAGLPA